MSPWLYLVLAHLIGDFVLQPSELVKLKQRPIGLAIHAGIHSLIMLPVAALIFPRWWLIVPVLGVIHYLIDYAKVTLAPSTGPASLAAALFDQAVHLGVLAMTVLLAGVPLRDDVTFGPPSLAAVLYYATPYIAATFAGSILVYQVAVAFRTRPAPEDLLSSWARLAGYAERGLLLTAVLFLAPAFWAIGGVGYVARFGIDRRHPRRWAEIGASVMITLVLGLLFRRGVNR